MMLNTDENSQLHNISVGPPMVRPSGIVRQIDVTTAIDEKLKLKLINLSMLLCNLRVFTGRY